MNDELPALITEAQAIATDVRNTFGHLNATQLNWKPSAEQWSVAQCFAHLIAINSGYFPIIERVVRGEHKPSLHERLPLLPRLFGSLVLSAVKPEASRKLKANARFEPSASAIDADIIAKFEAHQRAVVDHMRMTEGVDLRRLIITSPVASIATYSLLDAYRILVAHERRHMAQAGRVMESSGFPVR
jgi:hypothetical protein